ncbi:MAG: transglycosylase SLT domain-containing protein [Proteobacteria bacterium]|nr:transglycosylase SLT domain-containing protein [Pseudomonadota bacterium]
MPCLPRPNAAVRTACAALIGGLLSAIPPAAAAPPADPSPAAQCEAAIQAAERQGQTPPRMLAAVAQVESGRMDARTGTMRPWPWTIDVAGNGQFFATKAEAVAAVRAAQAAGERSIDVGCMQVNLLHHPDAFTSLDQALDPAANAAYAVRFLRQLHAQTQDWPKAIAAYHSSTQLIGAEYQRRVLAVWRPPPAPGMPMVQYADDGLYYGAFGTTGRVFGLLIPKAAAATAR